MTGLVGRLDLRTGSIELVNAGHVSPYLARGPDGSPSWSCPSTFRSGSSRTPLPRQPVTRWSRVTGSSW